MAPSPAQSVIHVADKRRRGDLSVSRAVVHDLEEKPWPYNHVAENAALGSPIDHDRARYPAPRWPITNLSHSARPNAATEPDLIVSQARFVYHQPYRDLTRKIPV